MFIYTFLISPNNALKRLIEHSERCESQHSMHSAPFRHLFGQNLLRQSLTHRTGTSCDGNRCYGRCVVAARRHRNRTAALLHSQETGNQQLYPTYITFNYIIHYIIYITLHYITLHVCVCTYCACTYCVYILIRICIILYPDLLSIRSHLY